jgi:hypothetical protein
MLRQINPVHTLPPYFLKINLNSTVISTPSSYQWSLAFRLSNQNSLLISFLPHIFPAHLIFLNLIILIFGEDYRLRISSVCSFLQPPVTSSLLGPNILLTHPHAVFFPYCDSPVSFWMVSIKGAQVRFYSLLIDSFVLMTPWLIYCSVMQPCQRYCKPSRRNEKRQVCDVRARITYKWDY